MNEPDGQFDERSLVERAKKGDQQAIVALLTRHEPMIRRVAIATAKSCGMMNEIDAEDIFAELFAILLRSLGSYDESRRLEPWLNGVTQKTVLKTFEILNREKSRRDISAPRTDDEVDANWLAMVAIAPTRERPSREAQRAELKTVIGRLKSQLASEDADLLVRCLENEEEHATVAADLGISKSAVAMRLYRIRLECQELLGTRSNYL